MRFTAVLSSGKPGSKSQVKIQERPFLLRSPILVSIPGIYFLDIRLIRSFYRLCTRFTRFLSVRLVFYVRLSRKYQCRHQGSIQVKASHTTSMINERRKINLKNNQKFGGFRGVSISDC